MRGGPHLERDLGGKRANRRYFLRRMKDGDSAPLRPQSDNAFRQNCEWGRGSEQSVLRRRPHSADISKGEGTCICALILPVLIQSTRK